MKKLFETKEKEKKLITLEKIDIRNIRKLNL